MDGWMDDETAVKSSPRLRLMLIVIGVVYYQTPNMLALSSLWEISQKGTATSSTDAASGAGTGRKKEYDA